MKSFGAILLGSLVLLGCSKSDEAQMSEQHAPVVYSGRGVSGVSTTQRSFLESQQNLARIDETQRVVARIGDWEMTMDELDQRAGRSHLRKLRDVYETRFHVLDSVLAAKLYELEAGRQGITARELFEKLVKSVDPSIDASQIAQMPIEQRQGEVEATIRQKIFDRHKDYVAELATKYQLAMLMAEPASLTSAGDLDGALDGEIVLGLKDNSPFDIEVYTDFTCPYCREVHPSVEKLISAYGQRVRFVFRPMLSGERLGSRPAAVASFCVYRQEPGRFMEFARKLFERQEALAAGEDGVRMLAAEMGMPDRKFKDCLSDETIRSAMLAGTQAAMERGIQNTPTVLIDGVPVIGNHDYATYANVVEQVFTARKAGSPKE